MSLRTQTQVTYVIDEDAMREIVEEEGLEGDAAERAIQLILSHACEIDLNALARHVFEASNVDLSEFEEDEEEAEANFRAAHWPDTDFGDRG